MTEKINLQFLILFSNHLKKSYNQKRGAHATNMCSSFDNCYRQVVAINYHLFLRKPLFCCLWRRKERGVFLLLAQFQRI